MATNLGSDNSASTSEPSLLTGQTGDIQQQQPVLPIDKMDQDADKLDKEIRRLQGELDEARSLVAVANYSLEESVETERRKCKEEVATLQQLMRGT